MGFCLTRNDSLCYVAVLINSYGNGDDARVSLNREGYCVTNELAAVGYLINVYDALRCTLGLRDGLKFSVYYNSQGIIDLLSLVFLDYVLGEHIDNAKHCCDKKAYSGQYDYGHYIFFFKYFTHLLSPPKGR